MHTEHRGHNGLYLVKSKTGLLQWNGTVWVNGTFNGGHSTGIMYNRFCPLYYCKSGNKIVNIGDDIPASSVPPTELVSYVTACGACKDSFSLQHLDLLGALNVPTVITWRFILSYMKLLRTVIDNATSVAVLAQYPQNTFYAVWYLDGNLHYCKHPHIYLFIAAIATLVFLWLPYTILLLFTQPLRRVSHLRPLKWINKLAPVYDAYFSPLKDN